MNIEKENDLKIKTSRENLIKEFKVKEDGYLYNIDQISQKYEKKIGELTNHNDKLENDIQLYVL